MDVHLIDGTYELFRHYFALPSARDRDGREVAAVRGVLGSVLGMIRGGATHVAVTTDHVIESFRNGLWTGYKTGEGLAPDLLAQFGLLEEALLAAGVVVCRWWSSRRTMRCRGGGHCGAGRAGGARCYLHAG
jgi:5'-3' exonuclease